MWILGFGSDCLWNNQKCLMYLLLLLFCNAPSFFTKCLDGNFLELCWAINYRDYNSMVHHLWRLTLTFLSGSFSLTGLCLLSIRAVPFLLLISYLCSRRTRFLPHRTFCLDGWPTLPLSSSLITEILKPATAFAQEPLTLLTNLSKLWVALRRVCWHCVSSWGTKIK